MDPAHARKTLPVIQVFHPPFWRPRTPCRFHALHIRHPTEPQLPLLLRRSHPRIHEPPRQIPIRVDPPVP
jgi:hypothetical protein